MQFYGWLIMESKKVAAIAIFTAISVVLVLSPFKFPAPFAPFLKYSLWEIPIVTAFLLFGPMVGISTSILNTIVLLVAYPGDLPVGPLYNFAAVLSMLLGIYAVDRLAVRYLGRERETLLMLASTAMGSGIRVGVMSLVNWVFLRFPYPVGFDIPPGALMLMLPVIGLFNATVVFYTIPFGYFVSRAVSFSTNIERWSHR